MEEIINLDNFMIIIKKAGYGTNKANLTLGLFTAGGATRENRNELSINTVKTWFNKKRPVECHGSRVFKEKPIDFYGIVAFFRKRLDWINLKSLKEDLRNYKFDNLYVDLETENKDKFCCSLANIFLDIIDMSQEKVNLSEKFPNERPHNTPRTIKEPKLPETLLEKFKYDFEGYGVDMFIGIRIDNNISYPINEEPLIIDAEDDWVPDRCRFEDMFRFISSIRYFKENNIGKTSDKCEALIDDFMTNFEAFVNEVNNLAKRPYSPQNMEFYLIEYEQTDKDKLKEIRSKYFKVLNQLYKDIKNSKADGA